ncbi:pyridoxamine 5'-phosphate oxidase family protein [Neptuniibacter halophilus]|uniref:pyridoxamine 5'-phosphate oxidase family protein n=1 Tax=Neptuniibacter halophilus TaxID=651666 RepID=UPI0025748DAC|nr:pyridoxamine 5'-phosphate oxidase family protein [Neptuniibacter halophilus]
MGHRFSEITFTPSVVAAQQQFGSYERVSRVKERMPDFQHLQTREESFIAARDSFYMASVSESGWPYLQHRGGSAGFLKVLDSATLGFVNRPGNGQYQSLGNLSANNRVALFLMDYPNKRRLKLLGRVQSLSAEQLPDIWRGALLDGEAGERVESLMLIKVEAFDWNCSQFITPRYTATELESLGYQVQGETL